MKLILTDRNSRESLYPFTYTRHTADIRIGILTIREKWAALTGEVPSDDSVQHNSAAGIFIPANMLPTQQNFETVIEACRSGEAIPENDLFPVLHHPWEIFQGNDWALRHDFMLVTKGRQSQPISSSNIAINPENIFIEAGATVEHCTLNAATGPVYIGKNSIMMEGSLVRGPFSLGENSILKMGSKIYGATTIGPYCVGGGEIKNAVFFGHSNKAHDGYVGDSVIGEWCNLGAGTSNSNVKNTGGEVRFFKNKHMEAVAAGNKAGLLMADYSRCAINTSFNTGTVVGVCCNIFGTAPGKYVDNFSWGNERYIFDKALRDISNWKMMKQQTITEKEISILKDLYQSNQ